MIKYFLNKPKKFGYFSNKIKTVVDVFKPVAIQATVNNLDHKMMDISVTETETEIRHHGRQKDIFQGGQSGEISFFPLETKKTFVSDNFKIQEGPLPPIRRPCTPLKSFVLSGRECYQLSKRLQTYPAKKVLHPIRDA